LPLCFQIAFFLILPPSFDIEFIISVVHFVTSSEWKFTDRWTRFRINYPTKNWKEVGLYLKQEHITNVLLLLIKEMCMVRGFVKLDYYLHVPCAHANFLGMRSFMGRVW
jgi:hypothetical protein